MKRLFHTLLAFALSATMLCDIQAQTTLTKEQILSMSIEELSDLPLEDLMAAVETLGVSSVDELFAMIMNKNVASASKEEESSFTSPLSTSVLTKSELRTWGVTTIEEALRLIPGVIVQEKTNGVYDIHLRGLNNLPDNQRMLYTENYNTLLLLDGRNIADFAAQGIMLESLPIGIEDIDRIEVVRGASAALYGQNAVQGLINIITEKPSETSALIQGNIQAGNNKTAIADVALRTAFSDKIAMGLSFNLQNRRRNTDEIYIPANPNMFLCSDKDVLRNGTKEEAMATLTSIGNGAWVNVNQLDNIVQRQLYSETEMTYFDVRPRQNEIDAMFPDPGMSRENYAINGYATFTPTENIRFDLTGGYHAVRTMSTICEDNAWPLGMKEIQSGWANLSGKIHDFNFNYGYKHGPVNYTVGAPGFKMNVLIMNGGLDYNIKVGNLSIRPAFNLLYNKLTSTDPGEWFDADPTRTNAEQAGYYYKYDEKGETKYIRLSAFFGRNGGSGECLTIAPSIRFDYKFNNWRFIAAYRTDKTSNPNSWNHSWQLAANREIGDRNFLRVSYGRANRSALLLNSQTDYMLDRSSIMYPHRASVHGDKHDLAYTDGIELGWRTKPTDRLLIDAELFYSITKDIGSLHVNDVEFAVSGSGYTTMLGTLATLGLDRTGMGQVILDQQFSSPKNMLENTFTVFANYNYKNLPYKIKQMGLSVNADWIISNKLIAKFNINLQRTIVDNYYKYNQVQMIQQAIFACGEKAKGSIADYLKQVKRYADPDDNNPLPAEAVNASVADYIGALERAGQYIRGKGTGSQVYDVLCAMGDNFPGGRAGLADVLHAEWENPATRDQVNPIDPTGQLKGDMKLLAYYALKHGINIDSETSMYFFGNQPVRNPDLENGHVHKATPSVYGMVGLIYKPLNMLTLSAFGNFIGERTYSTSYGTTKLDPRFTVNMKIGYKPFEHCELFFNAHNLFNSQKQEFVYMDKIGGIYTVGVNFSL